MTPNKITSAAVNVIAAEKADTSIVPPARDLACIAYCEPQYASQ